MSSPNRWYALYVRSRHENAVAVHLNTLHYETFLPLYTTRHKWSDRWKTISLPLFTGYVFCHFNVEQRASVLAVPGVIDIVRIGPNPAEIDQSEIDALRVVVASALVPEPHPSLVCGQEVTLRGGPLMGVTGTLVEVGNGLRLVVSVKILNRSVSVQVDREWVIPRAA